MILWLYPHFLWLLTLLPVIVLLHLWRREHRVLEVSALFLWQRALEVKSKPRRQLSWLLFLQLLVCVGFSVLLAQPRLVSQRSERTRVIIIDTSASMAAISGDGVQSRLDEAKTKALALSNYDGRTILIRAGAIAKVVSQEQSTFRMELEALEAFDRESDLHSAINLALDVVPDAELYLLSDALPESLQQLPQVQYYPLGTLQVNVGISTFDLYREKFFAVLYNNDLRPRDVVVQLRHDGQVLERYDVTLKRQGETVLTRDVLTALPSDGTTAVYELEILGNDALELDNRAYAGQRIPRVVVAPADTLLERTLFSMSDVSVRSAPSLSTGIRLPADLIVHSADDIDLLDTDALPSGNHVIFTPPSSTVTTEAVLTWDKQHPLLRFVDLGQARVSLDTARQRSLAAQEPQLLAAGWQVLARTSSLTPLIFEKKTSSGTIIYLGFAPSQTNLVRQPAWVIMMSNMLSQFQSVTNVPLGSSVVIANDVISTRLPGVYTSSDPLRNVWVVNLFSSQESALTVIPPIDIVVRHTRATSLSAQQQMGDITLWLLLVLLIVLLCELFRYMRQEWGVFS